MPGILDTLSQMWPARLAKGAWEGFKGPGDSFAGRLPLFGPNGHVSDESIRRSTDIAGLMTGTPGTPRGALGSSTKSGFDALQNAAQVAAQPGVRAMIPPPLSLTERTWQNYGKNMSPDDVLHHEATWGMANQLAERLGIPEHEAFSQAANTLWGKMGNPQQITPAEAKQFMASERQTYEKPAAFDLRTLLGFGKE